MQLDVDHRVDDCPQDQLVVDHLLQLVSERVIRVDGETELSSLPGHSCPREGAG
jgi:hypothetical protein